MKRGLFLIILLGLLPVTTLAVQSPLPQIAYGKARCANCGMVVKDPRFATAIMPQAGKELDFCYIECMASYLNKLGGAQKGDALWVTNYEEPGNMFNAYTASFLQNKCIASLQGAMGLGLGIVAFPSLEEAKAVENQYGGDILDWQGVIEKVREEWKGP